MKKKTLCGLLAAMMFIGAYPVSAFADDSLHKLTESLDFREEDRDLQGDGWFWDAENLILTLKDFCYSVSERHLAEKAAIYLPDESFVEIEGENNILETNSYDCHAFYCDGEVNFCGDGKIELSTNGYRSSSFFVKHGQILFDDELEITITEGGYIIYLERAKGDDPVISIQDKAKIIFEKDEFISRNILVTYATNVDRSPNWLDYAEITDDWDNDYMHLVAKDSDEVKEAEKDKTPVEPAAPETPSAEENIPEEPVKQSEYQITIGNKAIKKDGYVTYISDAEPYLSHSGYTMLPLRALLNVTYPDLEVKWDAKTKTATAAVNGEQLTIPVTANIYTKGETEYRYFVMPELTDGRLFISLRDWMDLMGLDSSQLSWDAKTKTVTMKY